jgi:hypothetical protein
VVVPKVKVTPTLHTAHRRPPTAALIRKARSATTSGGEVPIRPAAVRWVRTDQRELAELPRGQQAGGRVNGHVAASGAAGFRWRRTVIADQPPSRSIGVLYAADWRRRWKSCRSAPAA